MSKPNPANERIKREYFAFLREARGRDAVTIDRVAMSIARFEDSTRRRDFRQFHKEQAIAFKKRLADAVNERTGQRLSKATVQAMLRDLKTFFEWLSREPGYRSKIQFSEADYFNLNEKDAAIARARREKKVPTVAQVERVLSMMPAATVFERRNRALVAFAALTGARVKALATFQIGHVDLAGALSNRTQGLCRPSSRRRFALISCRSAMALWKFCASGLPNYATATFGASRSPVPRN